MDKAQQGRKNWVRNKGKTPKLKKKSSRGAERVGKQQLRSVRLQWKGEYLKAE